MSMPDDKLREQCGDVLLVGGTFLLNGKLVLDNGCWFPVDIELKDISSLWNYISQGEA